jgi:putative endopeptidase
MRKLAILAMLLISCAVLAQDPQTRTQGFSINLLDKASDPCVDFYQYACGGWMKANPVPSDQSIWGRFEELDERNQLILRDILQEASTKTVPAGSNDQKIGDYYGSCMDEKAIEEKGASPLEPYLDSIAAIKSKKDLPNFVADWHGRGANLFFQFTSEPDFKNATQIIAATDQAGIGLPDRDYYLKDDAKSKELRDAYLKHVQKTFQLIGDSPEKALAKAETVMTIETELAKASIDRVSRRDPNKIYHKMSVAELAKLSPQFDWNRYITARKTVPIQSVNVYWPDFVKGANAVIGSSSLDDLKAYMTWHILRLASPFLPKAFVDQNFAFYGKTLSGTEQIRPRWKRCVQYTDGDLGEALGLVYVDRTFGKEGKDRTLAMVHAIEKALRDDIGQLSWMTGETKKRAYEKLDAISNKIGYPEKWRDYSKLQINRGDALGNSFRANNFETNRKLAKIGKPLDKSEWEMTPPTVNAYYNPQQNNINFPAGILQPPFFDKSLDDAVNYGAIGAVIGHELTHGFDDEGRQFDAQGNLRDWWTEKDNAAFNERASCFADQYSGYTAVDDVKLNGKLTLGENVADNGGVRLAYMAFRHKLVLSAIKGKQVAPIDGFTPEQRLFLGWGQIWCQNVRPEQSRVLAQIDPHSPSKYRINGVVSNFPEFQKAFNCKAGQPMVRENACRVW